MGGKEKRGVSPLFSCSFSSLHSADDEGEPGAADPNEPAIQAERMTGRVPAEDALPPDRRTSEAEGDPADATGSERSPTKKLIGSAFARARSPAEDDAGSEAREAESRMNHVNLP
jgi:hypothetical protein